MTPNIIQAMTWFGAAAEFMWFDLGVMTPERHAAVAKRYNEGGVPEILHSDLPPENLPMPFEQMGAVIAHQGESNKRPNVVVTFLRYYNELQVVFYRPDGKHLVLNHVGNNSLTKNPQGDLWCDGPWLEELLESPKYKNNRKALDEIVDLHTELARHTYATLYIDLVEKKLSLPVYQPTPNPSNPKRIAKGKKPLFDWRVIDVTANHIVSEPGAPTGRTHASPRRHVRRGHLRKYRNGKMVWIKEMMVGRIEFGYIHHSYTTEKELANA